MLASAGFSGLRPLRECVREQPRRARSRRLRGGRRSYASAGILRVGSDPDAGDHAEVRLRRCSARADRPDSKRAFLHSLVGPALRLRRAQRRDDFFRPALSLQPRNSRRKCKHGIGRPARASVGDQGCVRADHPTSSCTRPRECRWFQDDAGGPRRAWFGNCCAGGE